MARLWAIVLVANLAGTLFAALFCSFTPVLPDELLDGMLEHQPHAARLSAGGTWCSAASPPAS